MTKTIAVLLPAFVSTLCLLMLPASPLLADDAPAVVLELFTSQGCSSCPPADQALSRLGAGGPGVVPLAFHVDYWNSLGWRDPFSAAEWSHRQADYARAFGSGRIYTPQAIVAGHTDVPAWDDSALGLGIARAAGLVGGKWRVEVTRLGVEIHIARTANLPAHDLEVMIAVYGTGLVTAIQAGENARLQLRNDFVVFALERAGVLGVADTAGDWRWTAPAGACRAAETCGVAVFLQDRATRVIHGGVARLFPRR